MAYLFKSNKPALSDLSLDLRDPVEWNAGILKKLEYILDTSVLAFDPVYSLLAAGTTTGTIHISGRPGVNALINVPQGYGVRLLQFAISTGKIVCVDDTNTLHVWDMLNLGFPKYQSSQSFRQRINSIMISASHAHVLIALDSGQIISYDLLCLRKSPYVIENIWRRHEQMAAWGNQNDADELSRYATIDVVGHPRNLDLIFIVYGGGIVLYSLSQQKSLRIYEYMVPAGAAGGYGYQGPDVLTLRRPLSTCLAVHPAGYHFAVGYIDGSIVFWAIENEDQPILARTLIEADINVVKPAEFDEYMGNEEKRRANPQAREPIFKLAWASYSENSHLVPPGSTVLAVLGGSQDLAESAVNTFLFPPFDPSALATSYFGGSTNVPQSSVRDAIHGTLKPISTEQYAIDGLVQDFILLPQENPHFSGGLDAESILIVSDSIDGMRFTEAFEFPPPSFRQKETVSRASDNPAPEDSPKVVANDLESLLESMAIDASPHTQILPSTYFNGSNSIIGGLTAKLENDVYRSLVNHLNTVPKYVHLLGGIAWMEGLTKDDARMAKYQPHRLLITYHYDLSIRFQDLSPQSLVSSRSQPLQNDFPMLLPDLTIYVRPIISDVSIIKKIGPSFLAEARIETISFASNSLECAVIFRSGEILVVALDDCREKYLNLSKDVDDSVVSLHHLVHGSSPGFHAQYFLDSGKIPVTSFHLSDNGFLAAAYADGSLTVIDSRGPTVLRRYDPTELRRHSALHMTSSLDPILSLHWTLSRGSDDIPSQKLIAVKKSGHALIFVLEYMNSCWSIVSDPLESEGIANPLANTNSFVFDSKTGTPLRATDRGLDAIVRGDIIGFNDCVWLVCGVKGARTSINITGPRIAKVDWPSKYGRVERTQIIEHNGSYVLVAFTDKHEYMVYSLPHLELIMATSLPTKVSSTYAIDETGDYVEWIHRSNSLVVEKVTLATLFQSRRLAGDPWIDLSIPIHKIPEQPQPLSTSLLEQMSSWLTTNRTLSGTQIDALFAGPDRPTPTITNTKTESKIPETNTSNVYGSAASVLKTAQESRTAIFDRLSTAVQERGQRLNDLQESFDALQQGSANMVAEAKKLAAKQTAKSWLGF